jgi:NADH-quinone oxidoreductase subunit G
VANQSPSGEVSGVSVDALTAARQAIGNGGNVVVVLGRSSLAESADAIVEAAGVLAGLPNVRFLPALRRSNVLGALDMGLAPGLLPGRVTLAAGRDWWSRAWGTIPEADGLDSVGILGAAAAGRVQALVLLGTDPAADFPDRRLAREALQGAGFVVSVDTFLNESNRQADVVLPAAGFAERPGTTTNIEGRVTRLGQKIVPPGVAWPDWMIASELAARLGGDLGIESIDELWDEIERMAPSHAHLTRALLGDRRYRDGVVAPFADPRPAERPIDPTVAPEVAAVATYEDNPTPSSESTHSPAEAEPSTEQVEEVARPPLVTFAPPVEAAPLPQLDGYSLRLVVTRKLYDDGTLVQHSPSLAPLARPATVRANHYDLDRLGLGAGGRVRVRSNRTSFLAEAEVDDGVPRGSVALVFCDEAAELIDVAEPVIDVRLETP